MGVMVYRWLAETLGLRLAPRPQLVASFARRGATYAGWRNGAQIAALAAICLGAYPK